MLSKLSIEDQYRLCFIHLPNPSATYISQIISTFQFNKEEFIRLLIKTDLESYTELLWKFGIKEILIKNYIRFKNLVDSIDPNNSNDVIKNFSEYLEHIIKYKPEYVSYNNDGTSNIDLTSSNRKIEELQITELLIFLMEEKENGINLHFKSKLTNNGFSSNNSFLTPLFIDTLKEEYKKRGYNEINLSYEEAENELLNIDDIIWIREYIERFSSVTKSDFDDNVYYFELFEEFIHIRDIGNYIEPDMIEEYAQSHYTNAEITLEFLKDQLTGLKSKYKKKVGAKPKNDNIASISEHISYLIRLKRFMNQDEYIDILKYPLSNNDCRLIHDYLVFFNLIPDQRKKTKNTTTPENYIKALIKNYRLHRKNGTHNTAHNLINSYKRNNIYPFT